MLSIKGVANHKYLCVYKMKKKNKAQINNQIFPETFQSPNNKEPSTGWATPFYCRLQLALLAKYCYSDQIRVEEMTDDVFQKGEMISSN